MQDKNGSTKRQSLMQVLETTPEDSAAYQSALVQLENQPEIPDWIQHIWEWFWELNRTRQSSMSGAEAISYREIKAWNYLKKINIRDLEVDILLLIDSIYLKIMRKKTDASLPANKPQNSKGIRGGGRK